MGALVYSNSLAPSGYSPYFWSPIPGLLLPYPSVQRPPEALSPERVTCIDQRCTPEKTKIGKELYEMIVELVTWCLVSDEDVPLNLSMKGRSRPHGIWSPGSLCEQEMNSTYAKPDSSVENVSKVSRNIDKNWGWDYQQEREVLAKPQTIGSSGEKTFTVRAFWIQHF